MEAMVKSDNKDQRLLGGRERAEEGKLVTTRQRGTLGKTLNWLQKLALPGPDKLYFDICSFYVCV